MYRRMLSSVRSPHGYPSGKGLLVRKSGRVGAKRVPRRERLQLEQELCSADEIRVCLSISRLAYLYCSALNHLLVRRVSRGRCRQYSPANRVVCPEWAVKGAEREGGITETTTPVKEKQ